MSIDPVHIDDYLKYIDSIKDKISGYEGCEGLEILSDKHAEDVFFSYSIWVSEEALENYRKSDLFREFWSTIKKWFVSEPKAWTVQNVFPKK